MQNLRIVQFQCHEEQTKYIHPNVHIIYNITEVLFDCKIYFQIFYFCWFLAGRRPLSKKHYRRVTLLEYRTMALLTFSTASSSLLPLPLHPSLQLHITTTAHRDNRSVTMIPLCSIQTIYIVRSQCLTANKFSLTLLFSVSKNSCQILWDCGQLFMKLK